MAQEIKELIDKINEEGIKAAQNSAKEIETRAAVKAQDIIDRATKKADSIIAEAKTKAAQTQDKTNTLLAQAARDFLLSLRKEINAMLERLITSGIDSALTAADLERIISELVKTAGRHDKEEIIISLKKSDLDMLEKKFLGRLKEETKKVITLKPSHDIRAGFTISFDSGRSCYDFTDKALAEYIGQYLKPKLNEILTPPFLKKGGVG